MRTVVWIVEVDGIKYMALSMSEGAAVRKALAEHRINTHGGQQLRLGQGHTSIKFWRSHRREMKKWQLENNKILM